MTQTIRNSDLRSKPLYTQLQQILILLKAAVCKENMQSASTVAPEYNQNIHNILHGPHTCLLNSMVAFRHSCIFSQGSSAITMTKQQEGQLSDHATPQVLGGLSSEVKWPGCEAGQSPPSCDEADNVCSYTSTPSWSIFHKTIKQAPGFSFYIHPCYPSFVLADTYSWKTYCPILAKALSLGPT